MATRESLDLISGKSDMVARRSLKIGLSVKQETEAMFTRGLRRGPSRREAPWLVEAENAGAGSDWGIACHCQYSSELASYYTTRQEVT